MNHLGEVHQIYNFGAVGNKYELIRFWCQKINGEVMARPDIVRRVEMCALIAARRVLSGVLHKGFGDTISATDDCTAVLNW